MDAQVGSIRRLEEVGLATWPALEAERLDGWDLRAAAGVTRRSNSVSPLWPSSLPLDDKVSRCEQWYALRGLPASFRMTELAEPGLEPELVRRRYVRDPVVDVMVGPVAAFAPHSDIRLDNEPGGDWFARFMERRFDSGTPPDVVREMLRRRTDPTVFASVRDADDMVAMGIAAVHDAHVAVYAMHTIPDRRGEGLGSRLLRALTGWGAEQGARAAFLQVHSSTPRARTMYEQAGFRTRYRYWYRIASR